jgi:hypothetical protein
MSKAKRARKIVLILLACITVFLVGNLVLAYSAAVGWVTIIDRNVRQSGTRIESLAPSSVLMAAGKPIADLTTLRRQPRLDRPADTTLVVIGHWRGPKAGALRPAGDEYTAHMASPLKTGDPLILELVPRSRTDQRLIGSVQILESGHIYLLYADSVPPVEPA